LRDRDHAQAKTFLKLDQLRQALHRAVVVDQLAQHACGRQAGERHQIDGRLRVAGALQHAARTGAQREDVAGLHQLLRVGIGIGQNLDRAGAVVGADARGNPLRGIDGDREIGAVALAVARDHRPEAEVLELMIDRRHADDATAIADHHVDRLRRGLAGGHDEVAFVFAILVVGDDDQFAIDNIVDGGLERIERNMVNG